MDPFVSLWKCVVFLRAKALQRRTPVSVCKRPAGSLPVLEGCFQHACVFMFAHVHNVRDLPNLRNLELASQLGIQMSINLVDDFQLTSCHSSGASEGVHHEHRAGAFFLWGGNAKGLLQMSHMNTQNDSSLLLGFTSVSLWDPFLLSFSFDGHASFFWPYCPLAFVSQLCQLCQLPLYVSFVSLYLSCSFVG